MIIIIISFIFVISCIAIVFVNFSFLKRINSGKEMFRGPINHIKCPKCKRKAGIEFFLIGSKFPIIQLVINEYKNDWKFSCEHCQTNIRGNFTDFEKIISTILLILLVIPFLIVGMLLLEYYFSIWFLILSLLIGFSISFSIYSRFLRYRVSLYIQENKG